MLAWLLALSVAAAPPPRRVAVYPVRHPEGRDAQAYALTRVIVEELASRSASASSPSVADAFAACETEPCLALRASQVPGEAAVVASWVAFGEGAVVSAVVLDDRSGKGTFTVARTVSREGELPGAAAQLATEIGDRLGLPPPGTPPPPEKVHSFGAAVKLGNVISSFATGEQHLSNFSLRLDLEADYLAAPEFQPFIDLSLVFAHDAKGQRVQIVPLLLGAKYVFRAQRALRPYAGMGLGLGFLSGNPDDSTSAAPTFAVYGVGGLSYFFTPELGVLGESSLNLGGLEASTQSGVLFALSFNFGLVYLF